MSEERKQRCGSNYNLTKYCDPYMSFLFCSLFMWKFVIFMSHRRNNCQVLGFLYELSGKACKPVCSPYLVPWLVAPAKNLEALVCSFVRGWWISRVTTKTLTGVIWSLFSGVRLETLRYVVENCRSSMKNKWLKHYVLGLPTAAVIHVWHQLH